MARRLAIALAAGLLLGGCCHNGFGNSAPDSSALARFRSMAKPHYVKRLKTRSTNDGTVATKDILPSQDELSESANNELRKKLVICHGCENLVPTDQPDSIWPKSSSGLTVDQLSGLFPARSASGEGSP